MRIELKNDNSLSSKKNRLKRELIRRTNFGKIPLKLILAKA